MNFGGKLINSRDNSKSNGFMLKISTINISITLIIKMDYQ